MRARVRAEFDIPEQVLCIGCVGNLSVVKDYMTLLRAIARFAGDCDDWRLLIFGDGPERGTLETFVRDHPRWAHRVTMPGIVDRVPQLLKAFDVFVLPSLTEGISNSLLEAMATGVCVVATATGGNPEVVIDGQSGLLFPVGDDAALVGHLRALEREPELRDRLGCAGEAPRGRRLLARYNGWQICGAVRESAEAFRGESVPTRSPEVERNVKLTEALELVRRAPEGGTPFEVLWRADSRHCIYRRSWRPICRPRSRTGVWGSTSGLYGDTAGTLEAFQRGSVHAVALALEWPDSIRGSDSGAWAAGDRRI